MGLSLVQKTSRIFRTNNIAITKERDELKQRFDGIDPEAMRALAAEKQKLEEAAQLKAGEVEKVMESRAKAQKGITTNSFPPLLPSAMRLTRGSLPFKSTRA